MNMFAELGAILFPIVDLQKMVPIELKIVVHKYDLYNVGGAFWMVFLKVFDA